MSTSTVTPRSVARVGFAAPARPHAAAGPGTRGGRPVSAARRIRRPLGRFCAAGLAVLLLAPATRAVAQDAPAGLARDVRSEITTAALREHAREITRYDRLSGSPGENAAIDHIVASLRAAGVAVEVHEFMAYASDPVSATVAVPGTDVAPDAITVAYSGSVAGLEAPLVDVGTLRDLPGLEPGTGERMVLEGHDARLPDVAGRVALVTGQPRNEPLIVLERLGAAGVIFVNPEERLNDLIVTSTWGTPSLRNAHRLPTLPVAEVARSGGAALRALLAKGPVRVRLSTETRTGWKPLRLAVARIPAPDPAAPYVLFGGHIDAWYHGGTDEGASNAAMIELAIAFHEHRDRLRRGLVVAWWPGHSNARYGGSTWFADHNFDELRTRAVAYVNVDGIGQKGAKRFGAAATSSLTALAARVVRDATGDEIRPFRPGRNSDQSFNGVGLPLLQLYHNRLSEDGGYWWWHTPDDTYDKIDFDVLETDAGLYADALAELLAAPALPVDIAAEVEALGTRIAERQAESGGRLDLSAALERQRRLHAVARALAPALARSPGADTDRAVIRILRPLHRVLYVQIEPFHPDPGRSDLGLLPGLAPARILAAEPAGSDRYGFAMASLVRERNRLLEALDQSLREAERLAERLGVAVAAND